MAGDTFNDRQPIGVQIVQGITDGDLAQRRLELLFKNGQDLIRVHGLLTERGGGLVDGIFIISHFSEATTERKRIATSRCIRKNALL